MQYGAEEFPRFYARRLPRSFGVIMTLFCGFYTVMIILAIFKDTSLSLILVSILLAIAFAMATVTGILSTMAAYETVCISPKGVQIRLGKLVIYRFPAKKIRAVVATTKEYTECVSDRQIYMVRLYWYGIHPQSVALWCQWSSAEEACFRRNLPDVDYLL